jgi:transglutaminase-like putative cysteine protease
MRNLFLFLKQRGSFMLTNATRWLIEQNFDEIFPFLEEYRNNVIERMESCSDEQRILMKFLYASMPVSDIADYDFDDFLEFTDHALFLKKNMAWCKEMPDDIFLNYVLHHRINNEDIQPCRTFFYDLIAQRIADKSMEEAALEVNIWCSENAAYQSTDNRTASPLAVWRNASGRCGEESTFAVTALRSVGIPARQIYTPRWSHCDDNHAWVEVWCDGKWHYMGACEPEPVLDKGWFTESASRAMLVHSILFSSMSKNEEIISKPDKTTVLNRTGYYAAARPFTVQVVNAQKLPVMGAEVQFEVLNQSEFYPVASKITDESGQVHITLGFGDIRLTARKEAYSAACCADTEENQSAVLTMEKKDISVSCMSDFKINVPQGDIKKRVLLTDEQKRTKKQICENADRIRKEKTDLFYQNTGSFERESNQEVITEILLKSKGNFAEIESYLSVKNADPTLKIKLLELLAEKDLGDVKTDVLLEHLQYALPFAGQYQEDIYLNYILCPRVYFEKITPYRKYILDYFGSERAAEFQNHPLAVWKYVSSLNSRDDWEYQELVTSPRGLLETKHGSLFSKRILFVAICRTIGVPARMNPVTLQAEYYQSGSFLCAEREQQEKATLKIRSSDSAQWIYNQNWTIAIQEDGAYRTLNLSKQGWKDGSFEAEIPTGFYRLIISKRLPNGNLFGKEYSFSAQSGKTSEWELHLPDAQMSELLQNYPLSDFPLTDVRGIPHTVAGLVKKPTVFIWLEEGREPTEHILNELIENRNEWNSACCQTVFIVRSQEALKNPTLQKTLETGLNVALYEGDFEQDASVLARSLYQECDKFPLAFITRDGLHAIYSCCGYNVGVVRLMAQIIQASEDACKK